MPTSNITITGENNMDYKYRIELKRVHGLEVYKTEVLVGDVVVADSQHFSKEYAITWALTTINKLRV